MAVVRHKGGMRRRKAIMKIDPNIAIDMKQIHVLCTVEGVELDTGELVAVNALQASGGPFEKFCQQLDPNTEYIAAFVPDRNADEIYFRARETAWNLGIHMQATIERPENQLERWKIYKKLKSKKSADQINEERPQSK